MRGWKHQQTILFRLDAFAPEKTASLKDNFVIWYQTEQEGNPHMISRIKKSMEFVDQVWDFSYHHVDMFSKDNNTTSVLKKKKRYFYVPFWNALHPTFFHDHHDAQKWD